MRYARVADDSDRVRGDHFPQKGARGSVKTVIYMMQKTPSGVFCINIQLVGTTFRGGADGPEIFLIFFEKALDNSSFICYNTNRRTTRPGNGSIAQLGEHMPYKHGVTGSSPVVPTKSFYGPVVQLVRTLACHARGQGFESPSGRQP